jgi:tRNA threonylcarbamoyladenosine biosynthesis protein TsaE
LGEPVTAAFALPDEAATEALAFKLASALPADTAGWIVLLRGELGAGKSTLARGMLKRLGHRGLVPSPTYTLVEPYEVHGRIIYHVDLYRISDPEELQYLGSADWADGLLLVEWPERAGNRLDGADLRIHLEYSGEGRRAAVTACTARGAAVASRVCEIS